ncbi:MAG: hypothetical protein WC261_04860 [Synergistaceae bacterium]
MPVEKLPETVPYLSNIRTLLSLPTVGSDKKTYKVHEEWEREQARRRQRTSGEGVYGGKPLKENLPEAVPYQSRDAVGAELGMSDFTY